MTFLKKYQSIDILRALILGALVGSSLVLSGCAVDERTGKTITPQDGNTGSEKIEGNNLQDRSRAREKRSSTDESLPSPSDPIKPSDTGTTGGDFTSSTSSPTSARIYEFHSPFTTPISGYPNSAGNVSLAWGIDEAALMNYLVDACYSKFDKDGKPAATMECYPYFDIECDSYGCTLTNLDQKTDLNNYRLNISPENGKLVFAFDDFNSFWANMTGWIVTFRIKAVSGSSIENSNFQGEWVYSPSYY